MRRKKVTTIALIGLPILLILIILGATVPNLPQSQGDGPEVVPDGVEIETDENFTVCQPHKTKVCASCDKIGQYITASMNLSVDPCDDFYQYACGKRIKDKSFLSPLKQLQKKFIDDVKDFLGGTKPYNSSHAANARSFFQSCKNAASNKPSMKDIMEGLRNHLGFLKLPQYFHVSNPAYKQNWIHRAASAKRFLDIDLFFSFRVARSVDKNLYAATISVECSPGLLRHDLFKLEDNDSKKDAEIIKALAEAYDVNVPLTPQLFDLAAIKINDMRNQLEQLKKYVGDDKATTCKVLKEFDSEFNLILKQLGLAHVDVWGQFVFYFFENSSIHFNKEKDVVCYGKNTADYMGKLFYWCYSQTHIDLQLYSWYAAAIELIPYTEKYDKTINSPDRADICAQLAIHFLDLEICQTLFASKKYTKLQDIVKMIGASLKDRVKQTKWIDPVSYKAVYEKLEKRVDQIGYPQKTVGKLLATLPKISLSDTDMLQNMYALVTRSVFERSNRIRTRYSGLWSHNRAVHVNVTYRHKRNLLMIHDVLINAPLFYWSASSAVNVVNFALIGSLIASEMVAALTGKGITYDAYGKPTDLTKTWSAEVLKKRDMISVCFTRLYNNYSICDVNVNRKGEHTLEVNLKDNGGLRHAFKAYKKFMKSKGCGEGIPGLTEFTDDQIFFIAFANNFCESQKDTCFDDYRYSEYPPPDVRVRTTLKNTRYFTKAFKCAAGTKMYSNQYKQCLMW